MATYRGRAAGSFGRFGVFSFNGNKIITTSGGGMLVCESAEEAAAARHLATQAREPYPHYEHVTLGYNYRLSNLLAALGRAQLAGLDSRIDRRRRIQARYRERLADLPGVAFMPVAGYGEPNWWLTCLTVDPDRAGTDREAIRLALEAQDIEARPDLEAPPPPTRLRHRPGRGGRGVRVDLRPRAVPPHGLGPVRRGPGPGGRGGARRVPGLTAPVGCGPSGGTRRGSGVVPTVDPRSSPQAVDRSWRISTGYWVPSRPRAPSRSPREIARRRTSRPSGSRSTARPTSFMMLRG